MRSFGDASPCGAASEVLVGLVNRTEARPTARTPIRSSVSMRKAHFMDGHPIRSSVHEKGSFHGRATDPKLGVHEKGSFHG